MRTPKGFELLPEPMQGVLNMLGASGQIHLETHRIADVFGGINEFEIQASYNVPPVSIEVVGKGISLEAACADVTWQFLEAIGMGPAE